MIYINGKKQGFQNDTNPVGTVSTSTHNWYIGALEAGSEYYTGLIDELKVYSTALTADQVKIDYNAGAALNIGTTAASESAYLTNGPGNSPVAYWNLNENTGTTVNDSSEMVYQEQPLHQFGNLVN